MRPKISSIAIVSSLLLAARSIGQVQLVGRITDDGKIAIRNLQSDGFLQMEGLKLESAGGHLIPIPPGDLTADADPFDLLLVNEATEVTFGSLGLTEFQGELVTGVGYDETADLATDLSIETGIGCPVVLRQAGIPLFWGASEGCSSVPRPVRFGDVRQGAAVANRGVALHGQWIEPMSLDAFEITGPGAAYFQVLDFTPLADFREIVGYNVAFDTNAPLGFHRATLTFSSDSVDDDVSFDLQAAVVPEPAFGGNALLLFLLVHLNCRRRF